MNARTSYQGACRCRRVTFELDATLGPVMECNCSLCAASVLRVEILR